MEELKPVPPAPKKKPNIFVRLLAFLVTLALLPARRAVSSPSVT